MAKSPTRFNVEVTEEDIARAHRDDSYRCVVSQAIARTVTDATNIDTDIQTIRFTTAGERRIYMTPYAVQGYIVAFDAGDEIEPFNFHLRDPKRLKRKMRTEAGRVVDRAVSNARRKAAKKSESTTPTEAVDPNQAARAAYKEAKAKVGNVQLNKSEEGDIGRPPPKVHKTKRRAYGHRLLRINQDS